MAGAFQQQASALLKSLAQGCTEPTGYGTMSPAVYDTAWVAMIEKTVDGNKQFLFPECFQFLLESQLPSGAWETYASEVDGILNTSAALLALKKHAKVLAGQLADLESRCAKAEESLLNLLRSWDIDACDHVGFEVLVPALLKQLEQEGASFNFPARKTLMALNAKKLAKFDPQYLYQKHQTTLLHSLEAFTGSIDFDKVAHHKVGGSMLASPSSTAAYLMNTSVWDDESEAYLRTVLNHGAGELRSLPCAFPTTIFEVTWVVTTLLEAGFTTGELGSLELYDIADYLEQNLNAHNGIVGWAPSLLPDADDTAKSIMALHLLGRPVALDRMIEEFESDSHFRTYQGERNSSFSANCNVLACLLQTLEPSMYNSQIVKAAEYLSSSWCSGTLKDKWNLSPHYSVMLLSQALVHLLSCWQDGRLGTLPEELIQYKVPLITLQMLLRTMTKQQEDGSWDSKHEVTAYAVLTLSCLSNLPWLESIHADIESSITRGRNYLERNRQNWTRGDYLWVEKVTYSSTNLSLAYCLAATKTGVPSQIWKSEVHGLASVPLKAVLKFYQFYSTIPLFAPEPEWKLKASIIENYLYLTKLRWVRADIFPPQKTLKQDKYVEYLSFTWTGPHNLDGSPLPTDVVYDMIFLSLLIFQIDEYIELVITEHFKDNLEPVKDIVRRLCRNSGNITSRKRTHDEFATDTSAVKSSSSSDNGDALSTDGSDSGISLNDAPNPKSEQFSQKAEKLDGTAAHVITKPSLALVESIFGKFITWVLQHPKVLAAPVSQQFHLRAETESFILSHLQQIADNARFWQQGDHSAERTTTFADPGCTYFQWARSIGANHIACPYSWAFFSCLIAKPGEHPYPSPRAKYLAEDCGRHLACMCRQYNDASSIMRDRLERNLNSINFPEFSDEKTAAEADEKGAGKGIDARERWLKDELLWVAEYERKCYVQALGLLEREVEPKIIEGLKVIIDVTDLYGQLYLARDITTRVR